VGRLNQEAAQHLVPRLGHAALRVTITGLTLAGAEPEVGKTARLLAKRPDDAIEALERDNRRLGAEPDWRTAAARWKRIEDVPDDVLFGALEAKG
jgi:hypothetical protein